MGWRGRLGAVARRWVRNIWLNRLVASDLVPEHLRWMLLRASGMRVEHSLIEAAGYYGGLRIAIGPGCYINRGAFLDSSAPIRIGARVSFGMNVTVITGSHRIAGREKRAGDVEALAVTIENGSWIGAGSIILPGVRVGRGAIVAAGSVVTKDVPDDTLVAGNPARVLRTLDEPAPDSPPERTAR
jgi:maltose O-acetyltransferase